LWKRLSSTCQNDALSTPRRKKRRAGPGRPAPARRRKASGGPPAHPVEALARFPLAAALVDARLRFLWVNEAFAALLGPGAGTPDLPSLPDLFPRAAEELLSAAGAAGRGGASVLSLAGPGGGALEVALVRSAGSGGRAPLLVLARAPAEGVDRAARARAERADEHLSRLQQVSSALSAAATEEEVASATFHGLGALGASGGSLSLPGPGGALEAAHAFGSLARRSGEPARHPSLEVPIADCFAAGEPSFIASAAELAARYPGLLRPGFAMSDASWAAVPLRLGERTLGVLGLGFAGARSFEEEDRRFIVAMAQQCAQALERVRLAEAQCGALAAAESAAAERGALVHELRQTLRERDESAGALDALFEDAPVGLALFDRDMRYLRVNAHIARLAGVPPEQHLGRRVWDVMPLMVREELVRDFQRVVESGKPVIEHALTTQLRSPLEPPRSFLVSWFPVTAARRIVGVGALVREVTEERRAEQSQHHLLGVVGHDLRSPLMAITASAELLQSAKLGERETRSLSRILRAAGRIDGIIRALVDYTLVKAGSGIQLARRRVDLGVVARGVAEEGEAAHAGRQVRVSPCEPIYGAWDADRVGQALANLVGNAIDYSPPDSVVEVVCRADGSHGVVEVTNQGAPIPADLIPYLFEPFRRGTDERTQRKKGLGLGLFIARQIVAAHGGTVELATGGSGTTFTIRLPLAAVAPESSVTPG